jgi:hypothetical protein
LVSSFGRAFSLSAATAAAAATARFCWTGVAEREAEESDRDSSPDAAAATAPTPAPTPTPAADFRQIGVRAKGSSALRKSSEDSSSTTRSKGWCVDSSFSHCVVAMVVMVAVEGL